MPLLGGALDSYKGPRNILENPNPRCSQKAVPALKGARTKPIMRLRDLLNLLRPSPPRAQRQGQMRGQCHPEDPPLAGSGFRGVSGPRKRRKDVSAVLRHPAKENASWRQRPIEGSSFSGFFYGVTRSP